MNLEPNITLSLNFTNSLSNTDDLLKINLPIFLNPRSGATYSITSKNFEIGSPSKPKNTIFFILGILAVILILVAISWNLKSRWEEANRRELRGEKYSEKELEKMRKEYERLHRIFGELERYTIMRTEEDNRNSNIQKTEGRKSTATRASSVYDPMADSIATEDSEVLNSSLLDAHRLLESGQN